MPEPLLRVTGVNKTFGAAPVLRNVDLTLERGCALGLVGASGSGKSTLARTIARFERPDSGAVAIDGRVDYSRADVQLIFQEAAASLNPRFTAGQAIAEPLVVQRRGTPETRRQSARKWLAAVGLPSGDAEKPALAWSGGERQRLAIARALVLEPKLLILDESLSGLDLMLQAQLAELLADLRRRLDLTLILISHDLALAARIAGEIAVIDSGAIVERAPAGDLMANPRHPRSVELVEAARWLSLKGALE